MKKLYLPLLGACLALGVSAQTTEITKMKVNLKNGTNVTYQLGEIEDITFEGEEIPVPPQADPKVGDYFYSDGTWSDGGLVSINADGTDPVWSATKPAPIAGKTVIGIVFTTDQSRMAASDIADGYTHGYVIACKNICDPANQWPETVYYARLDETETLRGAKLASTWYGNIAGRENTQAMLAEYPDDAADKVPMFYYGSTEFKVAAPANTSGWFIPSTGQMWDCLANLCGGEVAAKMKTWQTYSYDATYYCSEKVSYDVLAKFMEAFSLVPDADKESMSLDHDASNGHYVSLRTSTPYETDSSCIFNIGTDGLIEGMAAWLNEDCHARPILAF